MFDQQDFDYIFSDADVADIDFSEWDRRIDLYVVADHMPREADGRLALFVVSFLRCRSYAMEFQHLDLDVEVNLGPNDHFRWTAYDCRLDRIKGGYAVRLSGVRSSPVVSLTCEDIEIERIPWRLVDGLYPEWNRPSAGLMRPGLRALMPRRGGQRLH